jgi:amidase
VGLTSCKGVIPDSRNLDTVGVFGRTVRDAALALEAITGQFKNPRLSFTSFANDVMDLKGAKFGLPFTRVWGAASNSKEAKSQYESLKVLLQNIKAAGAEVIHTDFPSAEEIIPPTGWDWYETNLFLFNDERQS